MSLPDLTAVVVPGGFVDTALTACRYGGSPPDGLGELIYQANTDFDEATLNKLCTLLCAAGYTALDVESAAIESYGAADRPDVTELAPNEQHLETKTLEHIHDGDLVRTPPSDRPIQLAGWLAGWRAGWLAGWLAGWQRQ
jgi:hypothetical protein